MSYEKIMLGVAAVVVLCAGVEVCFADIITVNLDGSGDYTTIQAAIDVAINGDTVIVADGVYTANIDFKGKAIIVCSTNGPENCVIDGQKKVRGVYFRNNEDSDSILEGFTVTNCYSGDYQYGGGIQCKLSGPTIRNCIIVGNVASNGGGGISAGYARFENCIITRNSANSGGGIWASHGTFVNCMITDNVAKRGGGVCIWQNGDTAFFNCVIRNNTSESHGGGVYCMLGNMLIVNSTITENAGFGFHIGHSSFKIENTIIWDGIYDGESIGNITYSCVSGGYPGLGNLNVLPLLEDDGFHLSANSPCINAGTPQYNYDSHTDLEGQSRITDGRVDIGADEFSEMPLSVSKFTILGSDRIKENDEQQYIAICHYENGHITDTTSGTIWSIEPNEFGTFTDKGTLRTQRLEFLDEALISAQYDILALSFSEEKIVKTYLPYKLSIFGPEQLLENSSYQFEAVAHYDDESEVGITNYSSWFFEPNSYGNFDTNGLLTTKTIDSNTVNIYAEYRVGNAIIEAFYIAICPSLIGLEVTGPVEIVEDSNSQYYATANYEEGLSLDVTNLASWCVEPNQIATVDKGRLETLEVEENQNVAIRAQYGIRGKFVTDETIVKVYNSEKLHVPGGYLTIQEAIDAASRYDVVLVADGTYSGQGNRDIDFRGKLITVRSENGPDNCIINCNGSEVEPHRGFDFINDENAKSVLQGFTITNGYASGVWPDDCGGGIRCYGGYPTITNCIITGNSATADGGGISCEYTDNLTISNCTISDNDAKFGGGICCYYSSPTIVNCTINGNYGKYGGGIYCGKNNLTIRDCVINGNTYTGDYEPGQIHGGGGLFCYKTDLQIINCLIADNSTNGCGGGILLEGDNLSVINCTMSRNSAYAAGGIGVYFSGALIICNSIIWGDQADYYDEIFRNYSSQMPLTVTYSNIKQTLDGEGNIKTNPLFVDPDKGDYHLLPDSPCIDAGKNAGVYSDIEGNVRPYDFPGIDNNGELPEFDIGAYEFVNAAPVADAGADQVVYAWVDGFAEVRLDGTGSYDEDGDELEYFWYNDANDLIATGAEPNVILPAGEHVIELIVNDGIEDSEPNSCVITVIEALEVEIKVTPKAINRQSGLQYVKAKMVLPGDVGIEDVSEEALLLCPGEIEASSQEVFLDDEGRVHVFGSFDKAALMDAVEEDGDTEVTVAGKFIWGQWFFGRDIVKILDSARYRWEIHTGDE